MFDETAAPDTTPAPGAAPSPSPRAASSPRLLGALAVRLRDLAREHGPRGTLAFVRDEREAARLAALLRALDGGQEGKEHLDADVLPPWDCLPYDRLSPSAAAMGPRLAVLHGLTQPRLGPWVVLTTVEAAMQRLPPREVVAHAALTLRVGGAVDGEALAGRLERLGYAADERVDEPGTYAVRGEVIDLFESGSYIPHRIEHAEGRILAIRGFDPLTQRTSETGIETLTVLPASEVILLEDAPPRTPGIEHRLPQVYPHAETLFDYCPDAAVASLTDAPLEAQHATLFEVVADAHEGRRAQPGDWASVPPPGSLYLDAGAWAAALEGRERHGLAPGDAACPRFTAERGTLAAFAAYAGRRAGMGRRLVLAVEEAAARALAKRLDLPVETVAGWDAVRAAGPGTLLCLPLDLDRGFESAHEPIDVVAGADVLGRRGRRRSVHRVAVDLPFEVREFRLGDAVIRLQDGMGALEGIETVEAAGQNRDMIRLAYHDDAQLLVPAEEIGTIWRYGSDREAVTLDRLDGAAWPKRRAEVEAEIAAGAARLAEMAEARSKTRAPRLVPPERDYERFVARFPYPESPDQTAAIEDVLDDLASGHPMDRLVCGDVGFGKTEVALRAAAAAVLAGRQVAVAAPTTVLARQHVETFRRRFAPFGIEVANLSRLVEPAEALRVRQGLADGTVRLVVGTHALAGKDVAFKELGLLVIDEEQRFGLAQKKKLRAAGGKGCHVLTLTATPIPRTLQAAAVGLQEVSVLATPPLRRQPVHMVLAPFDDVMVRGALMAERRRGGQSFVVCPRIEDLEPMAARLAKLVPELTLVTAHGKLPPEEVDTLMVGFADGRGDVLLATSIIESGLDVPRANTMLVWHPDRFGLAGLHQLRGRVGRGRVRGAAYLLTEPDVVLPAATAKRLDTLVSLDRLGAGFEVSARDLDARGAGDLLGEEQAGHLKLIGADLYRRLLDDALRAHRGEPPDPALPPAIHLDLEAYVPADYIPEEEVRLNIHARLASLAEGEEVEAFEDELEDRFGPLPGPVHALLLLARLRAACRHCRIARIDGGPEAIALTFEDHAFGCSRCEAKGAARIKHLAWHGERLVLSQPTRTPEGRARLALELLRRLGCD